MAGPLTQWKEKVAIVTGASAGIGESLVKKLVEQGLKVITTSTILTFYKYIYYLNLSSYTWYIYIV